MTDGAQPTSNTVQIRGLNLHYLEWGNPTATPMVLLHGLSSAAGAWRRVAQHFAAEYRIIALDQRGHGESEWAAADSYGSDNFIADLHAFVDALGLERFVLIGHS